MQTFRQSKPFLNINNKRMRKQLLTIIATGFATIVMAGGIVTNTNQSATYIRMLARDASTSIDAVYFNPAGMVKLDD